MANLFFLNSKKMSWIKCLEGKFGNRLLATDDKTLTTDSRDTALINCSEKRKSRFQQ